MIAQAQPHTIDLSQHPDWIPNEGAQADFYYDHHSEVKGLMGGNRLGKTHVNVRDHLTKAMINMLPGLYVADSYRQLSTTVLPDLVNAADQAGLHPEFKRLDNLVLYRALECDFGDYGCVYSVLRSAEHGKTIANFGVAFVNGEEYALWKSDPDNPMDDASIRIHSRMSIEAPVNQVALTGTPEGYGTPMDRDFDTCEAHENGVLPEEWALYTGTTYENEANLRAGYIETVMRAIPQHMVAQVIEGKTISPNISRAYYSFTEANLRDDLVYDPGLPLVLTVDFNVEPLVWNVSQFYGKGLNMTVLVIDEFSMGTGGNSRFLARQFAESYSFHGGDVLVYGDPSGGARSTTSRKSNYVQIMEELHKVFGDRSKLRVKKDASPQADRVAKLNARLCNGMGEIHLYLNPKKVKYLKRDFEQVRLVGDKLEKKTSGPRKKLTHASDGLGEWIYKVVPDRHQVTEAHVRKPMKHQASRLNKKSKKVLFGGALQR